MAVEALSSQGEKDESFVEKIGSFWAQWPTDTLRRKVSNGLGVWNSQFLRGDNVLRRKLTGEGGTEPHY